MTTPESLEVMLVSQRVNEAKQLLKKGLGQRRLAVVDQKQLAGKSMEKGKLLTTGRVGCRSVILSNALLTNS